MFLHSYLLNRPTITERQVASRIATTIDQNIKDPIDNPRVPVQLDKNSKQMNNLIIHYIHEQRFGSFKKDIHQLWHHIFRETHVASIKLIVGNRNSRNATKTLVHRRPDQKHLYKTTNNIDKN
jgi:tRNA(Glu) U13 pseudouridine synthase TruD